MKCILGILLLSLFAFTACNDDSSLLEPNNSSDNLLSKYENLDFIKSNTDRTSRTLFNVDAISHFRGGEEIIELPSFKELYKKNYTVKGETGGVLFLKLSWINEDSVKVSMESRLTIPRGAFEGELTFDMIFDLDNYALELYPSPYKFDLPVILDLKFTHIDLSNIDLENIDFTYLDGEEKMEFQRAYFNLEDGTVAVKGAELHHFSRYGWTRRR